MASPPIPENVEDLVESPINPDVLADAMPSEPVCPSIPGLTFPELPDPAALGKLIGDKLDSAADAISESFEDLQAKAAKLEERIKNPPSPTDLMNEVANQVSSAADKAAKALEKAAIDIKAQVSANLAAEWDKAAGAFTDLESAMAAASSGAVDLGSLGIDLSSLPGDVLSGVFAGFKNAAECLTGEPGSAEEAFNKTAPELDVGVDDGRGADGATAALAVTETSKVVVNEAGDKVSEQVPLTKEKVDELRAEKQEKLPEKPITAEPVPVSEVPTKVIRPEKSHADEIVSEGIPTEAPPGPTEDQIKRAEAIRNHYYKEVRPAIIFRDDEDYAEFKGIPVGPPATDEEWEEVRRLEQVMFAEVDAILNENQAASTLTDAEEIKAQMSSQLGLTFVN